MGHLQSYGSITMTFFVVAVAAVQELKGEVDALKGEVDALKARIESLTTH